MPTIVLCAPHCQCVECAAAKRLLFAAGPLPLGNDERTFAQLKRKRHDASAVIPADVAAVAARAGYPGIAAELARFKAQFEAFQRGELK